MVHIVSEVIVLIGLTFYFNQKNKKLMNHIEDLAQRIEEQEDLLQKHENIIKKLVASVNDLHGNKPSESYNKSQPSKNLSKSQSLPPQSLPSQSLPPQSLPPQNVFQSMHQELNQESQYNLQESLKKIEDDTIIMEELDDNSSEDLDSAIAEELKELLELDIDDLSLKKQQ